MRLDVTTTTHDIGTGSDRLEDLPAARGVPAFLRFKPTAPPITGDDNPSEAINTTLARR